MLVSIVSFSFPLFLFPTLFDFLGYFAYVKSRQSVNCIRPLSPQKASKPHLTYMAENESST